MRVSVLIVSFRSEGYIGDCLRSVYQSDPRAEVIVVDNASGDGTAAVVAHFPQVRWVANSENVGFSAAVNQAAQLATGDLLLLLNPDTMLCATSIPRMMAALVRNPQYCAIGPISNNAGGMQSARHWFPNALETVPAESREKAAAYLIQKFGARAVETKLLTGFALMIHSADFHAMQGLDPQLILGFDDLDLCWRLQQQGKKIAVAIDSFVWHALHKSFEAGSRPVVDAMHQQSLDAFTRKLAVHYGGVSEIPHSMELWGVDWFVPSAVIMENAPAHLPSTASLAVVILIPNDSFTRAHLRFTLENYQSAGVSLDRILIVDTKGHVQGDSVDIWQPGQGHDFATVWSKISRWWDSAQVLFLRAGCYLAPDQFSSIETGTYGTVAGDVSTEIPSPQLDLSKSNTPWMILNSSEPFPVQWEKNAILVAMSQNMAPALLEQGLAMLSQLQAPVAPELPPQLQSVLDGNLRTGILGKGTLLDLQEQPMRLEQCQQLVWRLDPLDVSGMSLLLKELRESGLQRVVVIFDNAFAPHTSADSKRRFVNPLQVRRELNQAGFAILNQQTWKVALPDTPVHELGELRLPTPLTAQEQILALSPQIILEAQATQVPWRLEKKVSVVILAINQLEYTRKCIVSLQQNCRQPLEIILVDNGSTDGSEAYFRSIAGAKVIRNEVNVGVAAGWNQGVALATGDYVFILNNDTIVSAGCVENLVRCAEQHPPLGMVVPRCNEVGGPQRLDGFSSKDPKEIIEEAGKIQTINALSCWEFPRLKGVAMLIPRVVLQQVGPFDEQFGIGNFEDDDYCYRLKNHGYQLFIADDAFLYHYGSVSFKGEKIDRDQLILENQAKFRRKWANGFRSQVPANTLSSEGYALLHCGDAESARLYFVKEMEIHPNAENALGLAESLFLLGEAREAFAFYCRALEINPELERAGEGILQLLERDYDAVSAQSVLEFLRRKYPQLRSLRQSAEQMGVDADWQPILQQVLESGDWGQAWTLLGELLQRHGEQFEICNGLGIVKYQQGSYEEALRWFEKAIHLHPADGDALLNLYDCMLRLGMPRNAMRPMEYALSLDPSLHEVRLAVEEIQAMASGTWDAQTVIQARESNIEAEKLIREGLADRAEQMLRELHAQQPKNYRALNNLGLLAWYRQKLPEAFGLFAMAVDLNPWYMDAVVNLYDCAFLSHRLEEFTPWFAKAQAANPGHAELIRIAREIDEQRTPDRLETYFRKDAEQNQRSEQVRMGHQLLEEQKMDSAVLIFSAILRDYPDDVDALNGMGIAAFYHGRYEDAMVIFRHALQCAPLDSDTLVNYWDTSVKLGSTHEALLVLQNALAVDPSLTVVASILEENK